VVPPGSSLVEIDLLDEQPQGTLLRLTHTGLPNAEPAMRKAGPTTSTGWSKLQPDATQAQTLGMAALATSDWPPQLCILSTKRLLSSGAHAHHNGRTMAPHSAPIRVWIRDARSPPIRG
jgi:hypothetical protein